MDVDIDKITNHWKEPYPENLYDLLGHADKLAIEILENLNSVKCKKISELYTENNGKIIRNKKQFEELGFSPNESNEFKGLYIFGEEQNGKVIPVYVGISRTVFRRLRQHTFGKNHNQCSLAYLKTKHQKAEITRKTVTNEDMLPAKKIIQNYKVDLIEVQNDYDLYFLELVLAGKFKTKWNSFKTH
jgi:predicted GIY-YIG superfamily endonuclease